MRLSAIQLLIQGHLEFQLYNTSSDTSLVPHDPRQRSCFDLISRWMNQSTRHDASSQPVPVAVPKLVSPNPRESSCFGMISRWISQCTEHVKCSPQVPVTLPKRVIEIPVNPLISPKLRVTNGASGLYVILSHCWGTKGLMKLTNSVLLQYQEAIKLELLPNSFRDAIEITRRLGFRYLWIDALCIIQDDTDDWAQEAGEMASYYGLSTLMISATAAEDSSRGILNSRGVFHSPMLGTGRRTYLYQRLLRSGFEIERSVLATRGWCAQERILAPRILHYTRQQVIWECAEGLLYEAFGGAGESDFWKATYSKSECQQFVTEALSQGKIVQRYQDHNATMSQRSFEDVSLHRIQTWYKCVEEYSFRSLTVPTDKLHAIAGVARIMNHNGQLGEYLAGIWSRYLAVGLAWKKEAGRLFSPPLYTGPSWSWAGVEGEVDCEVDYPQTPTDDAEKSWAERFFPKLIEQRILLQNEHNVYGAVLEGSYITVEGACLTHADFGRFLMETSRFTFLDPPGYAAKPGYDINLDREDVPDTLATYDCCMYLTGDLACHNFRYLLLLRWVDQEASVAQRVGRAKVWPLWYGEGREQFIRTFEAANWERWTLKLV